MTEPKQLAEYVGFTESEVKNLCGIYQMNFGETRLWYDGYLLGESAHIYNPKSIVDAMLNQRLTSYWTRTETYEALRFILI